LFVFNSYCKLKIYNFVVIWILFGLRLGVPPAPRCTPRSGQLACRAARPAGRHSRRTGRRVPGVAGLQFVCSPRARNCSACFHRSSAAAASDATARASAASARHRARSAALRAPAATCARDHAATRPWRRAGRTARRRGRIRQ
jgi:hypothetical protein